MKYCAGNLVIALLLVTGAAHSAESESGSAGSLRTLYPEGAIATTEQAETALQAVAAERTRIDAAYRIAHKECQDKFAVTDCVNRAKTERRQKLKEADAVEIQAKRVKRIERARRSEEQRLERERGRLEEEERRARERAEREERRQRPAEKSGKVEKPGSGASKSDAVPSP